MVIFNSRLHTYSRVLCRSVVQYTYMSVNRVCLELENITDKLTKICWDGFQFPNYVCAYMYVLTVQIIDVFYSNINCLPIP